MVFESLVLRQITEVRKFAWGNDGTTCLFFFGSFYHKFRLELMVCTFCCFWLVTGGKDQKLYECFCLSFQTQIYSQPCTWRLPKETQATPLHLESTIESMMDEFWSWHRSQETPNNVKFDTSLEAISCSSVLNGSITSVIVLLKSVLSVNRYS